MRLCKGTLAISAIINYMAADRKGHILTTSDGTKIAVTLANNYANIADIVGVKLAKDKDKVTGSETVSQLRVGGKAVELTVTTKKGNDKFKHKILCEMSKVAGAIGGVVNKSINGETIIKASIPRRRHRR
jgi:hypothetical protein